jgi:5-(carboxyamino)imidazole ribonucleotide mutase
MAAAILGIKHSEFRDALRAYRQNQTETVLAHPDPREQQ